MDTGKTTKIEHIEPIKVPEVRPAATPVERPIPVPNWPTREPEPVRVPAEPVKVPQKQDA